MDTTTPEKSNDKFDLGRAVSNILRHWWWFALSLAVCLFLSWTYMKLKTPKYLVSSVIMLNQGEESSSSGTLGALGSLMSSFSLGGGGGSNLDDELIKITSHSHIRNVVKTLGINRSYWNKAGLFSTGTAYYNDSPVVAEIPDAVLDTLKATTKFKLTVRDGGKRIHLKGSQGRNKNFIDRDIPGLPFSVRTPAGAVFYLRPTNAYDPKQDLDLNMVVINPDVYADILREDLDIDKISKKANAIYLQIEEPMPVRGEELLNTIVAMYNERSLADSHAQALATSQFLEERLVKMYRELEGSEVQIENYKKKNNIVDAEAEAEYIFKKKGGIESELLTAETKRTVLRMIHDFLTQDQNRYKLIPFADEDMPEKPIQAYNELVLTRIRLEGNARADNATLRKVTQQIDAMRDNLLTSLERQIAGAQIAVNHIRMEDNRSNGRLAGMPTMERELKALYRDQVIKNQIYAFLLQKREENQMKLARNMPTAQVLDEAYTKVKPVSPNGMAVYAIGVIAGLAIPSMLLASDSRNHWTRRIRRRKKSRD